MNTKVSREKPCDWIVFFNHEKEQTAIIIQSLFQIHMIKSKCLTREQIDRIQTRFPSEISVI